MTRLAPVRQAELRMAPAVWCGGCGGQLTWKGERCGCGLAAPAPRPAPRSLSMEDARALIPCMSAAEAVEALRARLAAMMD